MVGVKQVGHWRDQGHGGSKTGRVTGGVRVMMGVKQVGSLEGSGS